MPQTWFGVRVYLKRWEAYNFKKRFWHRKCKHPSPLRLMYKYKAGILKLETTGMPSTSLQALPSLAGKIDHQQLKLRYSVCFKMLQSSLLLSLKMGIKKSRIKNADENEIGPGVRGNAEPRLKCRETPQASARNAQNPNPSHSLNSHLNRSTTFLQPRNEPPSLPTAPSKPASSDQWIARQSDAIHSLALHLTLTHCALLEKVNVFMTSTMCLPTGRFQSSSSASQPCRGHSEL